MFKISFKVGNSQLSFETADMKTIHRCSAIYGALPSKCDACGSSDLYLSHRSPKDSDFYLLACKACGAELTFHEKKQGKGFYIKAGEKMEKYVQKNGEEKSAPKKDEDFISKPAKEEEDVPF